MPDKSAGQTICTASPPEGFGTRMSRMHPVPWTVTIRRRQSSCIYTQGCLSTNQFTIFRANVKPGGCRPWTLDSGIPAGMTGVQHLCITARTGAWERTPFVVPAMMVFFAGNARQGGLIPAYAPRNRGRPGPVRSAAGPPPVACAPLLALRAHA